MLVPPYIIDARSYGAVCDATRIFPVSIEAGMNTVQLPVANLPPSAANKVFRLTGMNAYSGTVTLNSSTVTLSTALDARALHGPLWIDGGDVNSSFKTTITFIAGNVVHIKSPWTGPTNTAAIILADNATYGGTFTGITAGNPVISVTPATGMKYACLEYGTNNQSQLEAAFNVGNATGIPVYIPGPAMVRGTPQPYTVVANGTAATYDATILVASIGYDQPYGRLAVTGALAPVGNSATFYFNPLAIPSVGAAIIDASDRGPNILHYTIAIAHAPSVPTLASNQDFSVENLIIRASLNTDISGIDPANALSCSFRNLLFDTTLPPIYSIEPNTGAVALNSPSLSCSPNVTYDNICITGWPTALTPGEHARYKHTVIQSCKVAVAMTRDNAGYDVNMDVLEIGQCKNAFVWTHAAPPLRVGFALIEQNPPDVHIAYQPDVKDQPEWMTNTADITDAGNVALGHLTYRSHDVVNATVNNLIIASGATSFLITCSAGQTPGTARETTITVNGGTPNLLDPNDTNWQPSTGLCNLPGAGDWNITLHVPYWLDAGGSAINVNLSSRLYDNELAAVIADSTQVIAGDPKASGAAQLSNGIATYKIPYRTTKPTAVATEFKLTASGAITGGCAIPNWISGQASRAWIEYEPA